MSDFINPSYYRRGNIECIEAIASATEHLKGAEAFCTGNAIKYLWRWKLKGKEKDLQKAIWYIAYMTSKTNSSQ